MAAQTLYRSLGHLLVGQGTVKPDQVSGALEKQRLGNHQQLLGELLVDARACTEEQVSATLAASYGIPFARINPHLADPQVIPLLTMEFIKENRVLPLFRVEGVLTVALTEPANIFLVEEIERITGLRVQVVASTENDIRTTLEAYLPDQKVFVVEEMVRELDPHEFMVVQSASRDAADLRRASGEPAVVRLLNFCIHAAIKEGASDIHLEPGERVLRIRSRIDGRLTEKMQVPVQMHTAVASRIKVMAALDVAEEKLPQEGGVQVMMNGRGVDLRVSTMPGQHGETVVIRIIDKEKTPLALEKLGFSYDTLKGWRKALSLSSGLLLVTGPTGSGKSTTLCAGLQEVTEPDINLCTIEDPIEYTLPGVNQFQINEKAGFTFANALTSLLRQDPDILMVGDLRDSETTRLAVQAALAGHLVLAGLPAHDAPAAITRLYNLGIEPYLVAATIGGVLAQRLVRKLCQACRETYSPTAADRRQMEKQATGLETLYRPKGCARCRNTGYAGRVGIFELLVPDEAMIERISQGVPIAELRDHAKRLGIKTLRSDGLEKVKAGITTLDEVFRVTA